MTDNMIWMDLEMTGLSPEHDAIIEIATIVTDADLNELDVGPELVIHQSEERLAQMDEWNTEHHTASGLVGRVLASEVSTQEAEALTLEFIERHAKPHRAPLCGNTIWHDRRFLARHMPDLEGYLHHRIIDVSTVKELARRWHPELLKKLPKQSAHRALDDVRDSIAELRHYRDHFFRL